ncbi:MAG: ABC transporter substrate-binding protein [Candidatus Riflebacteria bacterium]|nr:ABC transporter substrate-binding protein [Candidatus Riflebacteria bacterium]
MHLRLLPLLFVVLLAPVQAWAQSPASASPAVQAVSATTMAVHVWPESLDPAAVQTGPATLLANLNEPLIRLKPDVLEMDPAASLAAGVTSAEDGRVWEVSLRPETRFPDGTPLDADAVVFSLSRLLLAGHPARPGVAAVPGVLKGLVKSVTAPRKDRVVIELNAPYGPMLSLLGSLQASVLSPASFKAGRLASVPLGFGPFTVGRQGPGRRMELVANPRYLRPVPLSRLDVVHVPAGTGRILWMLSGRGDLVEGLSGQNVDDLGTRPEFKLEEKPGIGTVTLFFNPAAPPFQSIILREALLRALNDDVMAPCLYQDRAKMFRSFFPPWSWGTKEAPTRIGYDVVEAKRLLNMGNVDKAGTAFVLWAVPSVEQNPASLAALLDAIKSCLLEVGVSCLADVVSPSALESRLAAKAPGAVLYWNDPRIADPDDVTCSAIDKSHPLSKFAGLAVDEVQSLIAQARGRDSLASRELAYGELATRAARDLTVVSLASPRRVVAFRKRLSNVRLGIDGQVQMGEVRVTP